MSIADAEALARKWERRARRYAVAGLDRLAELATRHAAELRRVALATR